MIKVLHIVSSLDYGGGVQTMIYNYYMHIDQNSICFDFIVHSPTKGGFEELFENMGSKIVHVTPKKKSLIKNMKEINLVLSREKYDVVHVHQNLTSGFSLLLAKMHDVPVRIAHSHGCQNENKASQKVKNLPLRLLNKLFANYYFACERNAGKWLFGKTWDTNEHNKIMYNAIDLDRYFYNIHIRQEYRKKYALRDKFVLIHVGRLSDEKNQQFSIRLLEKLLLKDPSAILLFVGGGDDEEFLKSIVKSKGLKGHVKFLGVRRDVPELMNSADVLLFPSKNEGLGMVAIEAQVNGLKVIASENVPKETALTDLIEYLELDANIDLWVEKILNTKHSTRQTNIHGAVFQDYSIKVQALKYEKWLIDLCSK